MSWQVNWSDLPNRSIPHRGWTDHRTTHTWIDVRTVRADNRAQFFIDFGLPYQHDLCSYVNADVLLPILASIDSKLAYSGLTYSGLIGTLKQVQR